MLKRIILITVSFFSVISLTVVLWFTWQILRDPLDFIDHPIGEIQVIQDSIFHADIIAESRDYHKIVLAGSEIGEIKFLLSLPDSLSVEKVPVLIILGGLEIGTETLKFIPHPGNNALVIYKYPYHPRYWYYSSAINEIPVIRKSVLKVPAQVTALYQWIGRQPWADNTRINLAGYSFGALFTPAIVRLIQNYNEQLKHVVISYGGADIYQLLVTNMTNVNQPWRSLISWLAVTAIRGIEPAYHAPYIKSDVLLINGTADTQIPESSWRQLHQLVPDPKSIVVLDEGHMHPRKQQLTMKLVQITHDWLAEKGAINPASESKLQITNH